MQQSRPPPLMLVAASLNRTALFRSPMDLATFRDFTLDNFTQDFTRGDFWFFFTNSVIISASAVAITLAVCVPLAYRVTKISGRACSAVSFWVLAMRFIPYVVLALPLFLIFVCVGLSGSRTGLLLAHLSIHIPFATWMLVGFVDAVPHELEEAGVVDGRNPWQLFWNMRLGGWFLVIFGAALRQRCIRHQRAPVRLYGRANFATPSCGDQSAFGSAGRPSCCTSAE